MKRTWPLALFAWVFFTSYAFAMPINMGVWSEWTPPADLVQDLPVLKERSLRLHAAVHLGPEHSNGLYGLELLLREAKTMNVEVWLWPLLPKEGGYWLNQWNAETYTNQVRALVEGLHQEGLEFAGVSMDLEPPPEALEELLQNASRLQFKKLIETGKKLQDEEKFELAKSEIRRLAEWLHIRGVKTHLVTTSLLLTSDPDDSLERSLGIPVVAEAFDHLSFMSYRSEFERILGRMNARSVYEHGLRARMRYGEKAGIDLGVVGDIDFPHPVRGYRNPKRLLQDLEALQAAGIERAQIYCWEGMRDPRWVLNSEKGNKPLFSLKFSLLDALLTRFQEALTKP